jgi:UDP-glucose 4-epimerase
MRVLVTGASGFVGRALIPALAGCDVQVLAAARNPDTVATGQNVGRAILPDLVSDIDWASLLTGIDAVVHLAGIAHAGGGIADETYDRVNRAATEALARACQARGIRLVFVSSIRAQSGPSADHILTERDAAHPTDAYGRSKLAAEKAVHNSGAAFTILRPVVIYGAGVKGNIASLLRLADTPYPLPLSGFRNRRSLLAIDNLVSAIRHILAHRVTEGETYIVADANPVSLADIVGTLRAALGRPPRLFPFPPLILASVLAATGRGHLWSRIGGDLVVDAAKLRETGWTPIMETHEGLTAMAQAASPRKSGTASRSTP